MKNGKGTPDEEAMKERDNTVHLQTLNLQ